MVESQISTGTTCTFRPVLPSAITISTTRMRSKITVPSAVRQWKPPIRRSAITLAGFRRNGNTSRSTHQQENRVRALLRLGPLPKPRISVAVFDSEMVVLPVRGCRHQSLIDSLRDVVVLIDSTTVEFDLEGIRTMIVADTFQVTRRNGCSVHSCGI